MKLVISLEHRFNRTPDGTVWTQTMFAHTFWTRYLAIFDSVRILARVRDVSSVPCDWSQANGDCVSFASIPYYIGPSQYTLRALQIRWAVRNALCPDYAVIMRIPSQIATSAAALMHYQNHPYGVEVVGDPYDVFAAHSVSHPLRRFFRWWFTHQMRRQCAKACAAAYVTKHTIQRRYPPAASALSTYYSDVELHESAFIPIPRVCQQEIGTFNLICVGSLAQPYKGFDVLIHAIARCIQSGLKLKLIIVGDGKYRAELEAQTARLGLEQYIRFCGQLTAGDAVRAQLDQADLFVMPSKTEGLPRAMIEAMARALPCIGSSVGGIPELLLDEDMVSPGDVAALARKLREVLADPQRMTRMSARNLECSKAYHEDALRTRRLEFYHYIRESTEAWLAKRVED